MYNFIISIMFFLLIFIPIGEIFGQNETTQTEINRLISQPDPTLITSSFTPSEFLTAVSIGVNIILVIVVVYTVFQTKEHFFAISRPWINIRKGNVRTENNYLELIVKNHGKLSAENMNITYKDLSKKESKVNRIHSHAQILMPSQEDSVWFDVVNDNGAFCCDPQKKIYKMSYDYNVEITITFSYDKQNKKVVFQIFEDTDIFDDGPSIKIMYID